MPLPIQQELAPALRQVERTPASDPLSKAARDFEALLLGSLLESMFKGVKSDGLVGGGQGEETWRSFLLQEYGSLMAESDVSGVGQTVERMLRSYQAQRQGGGNSQAEVQE